MFVFVWIYVCIEYVFWFCSFSFCDIGAGDVPWKETIAALDAIQYKSTIIAEMLPWDETILSRTSAAMDQLFNFK